MTASTIAANQVELSDLIDRLDLTRINDLDFFSEWQTDLPTLADLDRQLLDRVRDGYFNLIEYPPLREDAIRMAILDPILFIAGLYLPPFHIRSEAPISLEIPDEDRSISGRIDTLIFREHLWVMVIEAKRASLSIEAGLAQLLTYLLAAPNPTNYGLITSGGEFIFVKLEQGTRPKYATSDMFVMRNRRRNELYEVLQILKKLADLTT
ncbi:MAG: restriction endonuclease subunit R [Geitlerinemataceae cyanobacterium]